MAEIQSGIYMWRNKITGRVLVGQTCDFKSRKAKYLSALRKGTYGNKHFQRSWTKHGEDAFEMIILEHLYNIAFLTGFEQAYVDYYRTLPGGVYNEVGPVDCPRRGAIVSEETKLKLSKINLGKKQSDDTKRKKSVAAKGKIISDAQKQQISLRHKGKTVSLETRQKLSAAFKGKPGHAQSEEAKIKIGNGNRGRKASAETKKKLSEAHVGQKNEHRFRSIERFDSATGEAVQYESIAAAARSGFSASKIGEACRSESHRYRGFLWYFLSEAAAA